MLELRDGTEKNWQASLTHMGLHKTNTRWLVRVVALLVLGRTTGNSDTQDSPRLELGEAITFPLIVYFLATHGSHIEMIFYARFPKWESRNY